MKIYKDSDYTRQPKLPAVVPRQHIALASDLAMYVGSALHWWQRYWQPNCECGHFSQMKYEKLTCIIDGKVEDFVPHEGLKATR